MALDGESATLTNDPDTACDEATGYGENYFEILSRTTEVEEQSRAVQDSQLRLLISAFMNERDE